MCHTMKGCFVFFILLSAAYQPIRSASVFGNFDKQATNLNNELFKDITPEEWLRFVQYGTESINREKNLEQKLIDAQIKVENGTLSHVQFLDAFPGMVPKTDSEIAKKILKAGQYVFNLKCAANTNTQCSRVLADQPLPSGSKLLEDCQSILTQRLDGYIPFRRLLPKNYRDGIHEMFYEETLPAPRLISSHALNHVTANDNLLSDKENLALVQWAQFIEHDLSKPVVATMTNGVPIDCCSEKNFKLAPRHYHPACEPLLTVGEGSNKYGRESCLNYVRSALVIGSSCNFAAVEQLNHATGFLDLSQLYGFTTADQQRMRSFKNGQLKSSKRPAHLHTDFLPSAELDELHEFCAVTSNMQHAANLSCFVAGDSRVNSNPFAVAIYTIFMRNHNNIAHMLKAKHGSWDDEKLFRSAKAINIISYRRIIFDEWLPTLLGNEIIVKLKTAPLEKSEPANELLSDYIQISNEFAVAAMRFYFSMMPDKLKQLPANPATANNKDSTLFVVKDQAYRPNLFNHTTSIDIILESLLHQPAMKMDSEYEDSYVLGSGSHPTHADILAIDIQRGRDHGLQVYFKYLEACQNVKIKSWRDLEPYFSKSDLQKLKSSYTDWEDIDLIVGGIAEKPQQGSVLGPTFTCILAEQFHRIYNTSFLKYISSRAAITKEELEEIQKFKAVTAADIVCLNSNLSHVPKNIFQLVSKQNPLIPCKHITHFVGI